MSASRCGWGSPCSAVAHPLGHEALPGGVLDVGGLGRRRQRQVVLGPDLTAPVGLLAADRVDGLVVDHRQQPGGDAATAAVEGAGIAPDAEEDVLQHVLGQDVVTEHPAGEREGRPAEPLVQVVDRSPVTGGDPAHQLEVSGAVLGTAGWSTHEAHRHMRCSRVRAQRFTDLPPPGRPPGHAPRTGTGRHPETHGADEARHAETMRDLEAFWVVKGHGVLPDSGCTARTTSSWSAPSPGRPSRLPCLRLRRPLRRARALRRRRSDDRQPLRRPSDGGVEWLLEPRPAARRAHRPGRRGRRPAVAGAGRARRRLPAAARASGEALFELSGTVVGDFLRETELLVPAGTESDAAAGRRRAVRPAARRDGQPDGAPTSGNPAGHPAAPPGSDRRTGRLEFSVTRT